MHTTAIKLKLKPTKQQEQIFWQWLGVCRFIYNLCKQIRCEGYKNRMVTVDAYELMKQLTVIREDIAWIAAVHSQVLQDVIDRLHRAYVNFFEKRARFPKWANRRGYNSFTFKQGMKLHFHTCRIQLPKIGKVRFFKDKGLPATIEICTATIIRESDGWYVCLTYKTSKEQLKPVGGKGIGIDLGIKSFAVTSDGQFFEYPQYYRKHERKLRRLNKSVSRKKKGSNNWKKAVKELAVCHKHVADCRHDYQHKLSLQLVTENQIICVEKLNIRGLKRNGKLAKSIHDAGWGGFKNKLKYKCEWYGRTYIEVDPKNTSKTCSCCGYVMEHKLPLHVREWTCPQCGTKHERDHNAAKVIHTKGLGQSLSTLT